MNIKDKAARFEGHKTKKFCRLVEHTPVNQWNQDHSYEHMTSQENNNTKFSMYSRVCKIKNDQHLT